jgi:diketogulonate reductase-like aldo/keto reductase
LPSTDTVYYYIYIYRYFLLGGRQVDGAHLYLNHAAIGEAITEAIKRGIPRSEMFITTKIYPSVYGEASAGTPYF